MYCTTVRAVPQFVELNLSAHSEALFHDPSSHIALLVKLSNMYASIIRRVPLTAFLSVLTTAQAFIPSSEAPLLAVTDSTLLAYQYGLYPLQKLSTFPYALTEKSKSRKPISQLQGAQHVHKTVQ